MKGEDEELQGGGLGGVWHLAHPIHAGCDACEGNSSQRR